MPAQRLQSNKFLARVSSIVSPHLNIQCTGSSADQDVSGGIAINASSVHVCPNTQIDVGINQTRLVVTVSILDGVSQRCQTLHLCMIPGQ